MRVLVYNLIGSRIWEIRWVDECRYEKCCSNQDYSKGVQTYIGIVTTTSHKD